MIRISDISLPINHDAGALRIAAARELGVDEQAVLQLDIVQKSIDARKRNNIVFLYTVHVRVSETAALAQSVHQKKNISIAPDDSYRFLLSLPEAMPLRPVIIGAGPCGLFAALLLSRLGLRPIILERGKAVRDRYLDVQRFWTMGTLLPDSNALFGEGGAGAFSDGKLVTQIKDRAHRRSWIIQELIEAGAPPEIGYHHRPHIGTDNLMKVVENLRDTIIGLGGEVRYQRCVTDLLVERNRLCGLVINNNEELPAGCVLLAIGHSARDTFQMLYKAGVAMTQKSFSIGARIEHPQGLIDRAQYGGMAGDPLLGAAEYRLSHHCGNGRTVYSFCMCPGGEVIGVSTEPGGIVTNGMSCFARNGRNANSGLLVGVGPDDFGDDHPLAGIAFQRRWEQAAFALADGGFKAPVQRVGDMLAKRATNALGAVAPSYRPGVVLADLAECLPPYVLEAWREAIPAMARKVRHFDLPDAVLTGVETRSSSPVRIERDMAGESLSVRGLFPAGEGAGYAGGIISAAVDGMRAAEQMALQLCEPNYTLKSACCKDK